MTVTSSLTSSTARPGHSGDHPPWAPLCVLLLAAAMDLIGMTVATMALPTIGRDLGAGPAALQWTIAGYGLAFALLLVTGGRLGDIFGRRRILLSGVVGFAATSAIAGVAPTASVLVAARVAQGGFAGLMIPQVLATITATFPVSARARAFGLFGATAGLSAVAGPLLGGLVLDAGSLGWRAIFLINIPAAVFVLLATRRWVAESRSPHPAPLDLSGIALLTAALAMLMLPLIEGPQRGWPMGLIAVLGLSGPGLALFAIHQRRRERSGSAPLVPTSLFRQRGFVAGSVAALMFFSGPPSLMFVTTHALQALGHSPLTTALSFVPLALASVPAAAVSANLVEQFGRRVPISGVTLVFLGTAAVLGAVTLAGSELNGWHLLPGLATAGLGLGLVAPTLIGFVLSDVGEGEAGAASGVLNTVQQFGGALGIALIGLVYFGSLSAAAPTAAALADGLCYLLLVIALSGLAMLALPNQRQARPDGELYAG